MSLIVEDAAAVLGINPLEMPSPEPVIICKLLILMKI
jgi:hypothetical protein